MRLAPDGSTRLSDLFQQGSLKIRMPYREADGGFNALLINTSGGLTGGDELSVQVVLEDGTRATVTTPGCERVYRSAGGDAHIRQHLQVGRGARLDWIPQETILFNRARLRRRFEIELEAGAEITLAESIVFGRAAMGETVTSGFLSDFWSIRREGRLVFADAVRMSDPLDRCMHDPTTLGGNIAIASLVHVGSNLEFKRDSIRAAFAEIGTCAAGASLIGDVLVARMAAESSQILRTFLIKALGCVRDGRGIPRNWFC